MMLKKTNKAQHQHQFKMTMTRTSSIPHHADFHAVAWNLPFAADFAAYYGKTWNRLVFITFIPNSTFFGLP